MSNRIMQTYCGSDSKTGESMHPQSMWIARWMQTSSNSEAQVHNHLSLHDESRGKDHDSKPGEVIAQIAEPRNAKRLAIDGNPCNVSEYRSAWWCQQRDMVVASDVPQSAKAVGAVTEARRVEITNETIVKNSGKLMNTRSKLQPFKMFDMNKNMENILAQEEDPVVCDKHATMAQTDENSEYGTGTVGASRLHFPSRILGLAPIRTEFPLKEYHSQPESISQSPRQWINPCRSLEVKALPVLGPFQDDLTGSTSNFVPCGFKSGGAAVGSFMCRKGETDLSSSWVASKENIANSNFIPVVHEKCNYNSYSTYFVCDKKTDSQLVSQKSENSYSGQNSRALQLHHPLTSNFCFPVSVGEQGKGKHGSSGTGRLLNHSSPAGVREIEEFYHGQYSLHRMPACSIHDVGKVQICTTVDSVGGVPGGPPKFSQTAHHMLIAKKTDVNLSKGKQIIRDPTLSTTFQGNAFHELPTLPPVFDLDGKCGLKIQFVGSSNDSEGKEDVRDVKTGSLGLEGESSAETDTMDITIFEANNSLLSIASSPLNKDFMVDQNPARFQAQMVLQRQKTGIREMKTALPDINHEPPAILAAAGSMDNKDLSTSRTESLDVDHLFHVERADNSTSSTQQNSPLHPEPSSRWVKRLKLCASDSHIHGTQSTSMGDALSSEKVANLFGKVANHGTSSGPTLGKCLGKGHMELDRTVQLIGNRKPSTVNSVKEQWDISLLRSWIKRWCHNQAPGPLMKPTTAIACKPESMKVASDDLQRKQFPSIAAMALMGKALSGFQACEFHKRGSSVVWNTMGF